MTDAVTTYRAQLGIVIEPGPDDVPILRVPFHRGLVGRPGRLHGGAIAALLEQAVRQAVKETLHLETARLRPCTMTVDFLRSGMERDLFATAHLIRQGRRLLHAQADAWQEERALPIATAHMVLRID